jgi:ankyrin repeat protein
MKLKLTTLLLLLAAAALLLLACNQKTQTIDLLTAIDTGQSDVVQELLESGIDPNKDANSDGAYPLHLAVVKGNKGIVQILLDNGAAIDIKAKNKDGATPLAWAAFIGRKDMVSLLIEAGASINILDGNHATPLDAAVFAWRLSHDDEETANRLMEIITILKANGGKHADDL